MPAPAAAPASAVVDRPDIGEHGDVSAPIGETSIATADVAAAGRAAGMPPEAPAEATGPRVEPAPIPAAVTRPIAAPVPAPSAPEPHMPVAVARAPMPASGRAIASAPVGTPVIATTPRPLDHDDSRPTCTVAQLRRFIKSRPWIPMHELRRRFGIYGGDDDVTPIRVGGHVVFVGLPQPEGRLMGELLSAGDVGYELSLDPVTPIVVGVYPMRPVPRS